MLDTPSAAVWFAGRVDSHELLDAFDEQLRRRPDPGDASESSADDGTVIRRMSRTGWNGVTWAALDEVSADAVIAGEIARFAELGLAWEWKYYSYDRPVDLPSRLLAAGFRPEPQEGLLVAEISQLELDVPPPSGIELREVTDEAGVAALVAVNDEVFGPEHGPLNRELGRDLLAGLQASPARSAGVIAIATDGTSPIAAGRVDFHHGTDFASLWGGGTIARWRGHGAFRALVAQRAAAASARGFRYLRVDASADSRPILRRLGFVEIATTTPYIHSGSVPAVR